MLQWQTLDKETPMHRKLHNRMFTYVASVATVAVAAAMIAVGAPAASAAPRTIAVVGKITGFGTPTINVKAGEQVSICLTSPDMPHDLTISDLNFKVASSGPSTCKTLTAPAAAGSHPFICSVQGHSGTMKGSLVVGAAAGAAAPAAGAPAAGAPAAGAPAAGAPQVAAVPAGGVQTGGGSTAGLTHVNLLTLGGGLLVAAMMSVLLGTRVARKN
jgi:heme/copper-type cytochrome/quinol oxidase subunit 2